MVYITLLIWILLLEAILRHSKYDEQHKKKYEVIGVFVPLFIISAVRYGIGFDYFRYGEMFDLARLETGSVEVSTDIGFTLLLKGLNLLELNNLWIYAVLAFICLAPVAYFIYKYSPTPWLSWWLYITLAFFGCSMNFIRQSMALSFVLLAWPLLKNKSIKNSLLFLLIMAVAFTIHASVIVMIPVVIMMYVPLNKWTVAVITIVDLICVIFAPQLLDMFCLAADGHYYFLSYHITPIYLVGLGKQFLIVPFILMVCSLLALPELRKYYKYADDLVKMMIGSMCIWSFITQFQILERFSLFLYAFSMLVVPCMITAMKREEHRLWIESRETEDISSKNELRKKAKNEQLKWKIMLAVILISTFTYFAYGLHDGFHGVYPYDTWLRYIQRVG